MACVIAMVDLGVEDPPAHRHLRADAGHAGRGRLHHRRLRRRGDTVYAFGNMVVSDPMGNWLKCFSAMAMMVAWSTAARMRRDRDMLRGGEMFTLAMFSLLGMFVMISGEQLPGASTSAWNC